MAVNGAVLINTSPLREFSRQAALLPVFAGLAFRSGMSLLPHWTSPYPPISQGPSPAPTQKPSRRTLGPSTLETPSREGNRFAQNLSAAKHSQEAGLKSSPRDPFFSLMGVPPELPCAPWAAVPCLLQAAVPTLSLSPQPGDFLLGRKNFFFSLADDSILVAIDYL